MNAVLDRPAIELAWNQATPLRPAPPVFKQHRDFWLSGTVSVDDITLALPDTCVDEIDAALSRLPALPDGIQPTSTVLASGVREAIPGLALFADEVRERLDSGAGSVIVDRFPAGRWSDGDNRRVSALFSELVSPLKAQDFDGTLLYDVLDRKVEDVSKVRRSITNLRQDYHTDGPWVPVPARYIGLYCIRNAGQGGVSSATSLLCAMDALRTLDGGVHLEELMRPQPWDRQGEHADGDSPFEEHPLFVETETGVVARFYEGYVRRGHELAERVMTAATDAALSALSAQLEAQPAVRFLMEPGQFQYANNYTVVHARDAFEDDPSSQSNLGSPGGRRLVRVWHA